MLGICQERLILVSAFKKFGVEMRVMEPSIYEFESVSKYLKAVYAWRQENNSRYSLHMWGVQLGMRHPSLLSMVLNGRRKIQAALAAKLKSNLNLDPTESLYFEMLIVFSNHKSVLDQAVVGKLLRTLVPVPKENLVVDQVQSLSQWYYWVIWELTRLKDFNHDPIWISKKLAGKVPADKVQEAIEVLLSTGMLKVEEGQQVYSELKRAITPTDIPSPDLRSLNRQFLGLASDALDEFGHQERDLTTRLFASDHQKMADLKLRLRELTNQISAEFNTQNGDVVFCLHTALFPVTKEKVCF